MFLHWKWCELVYCPLPKLGPVLAQSEASLPAGGRTHRNSQFWEALSTAWLPQGPPAAVWLWRVMKSQGVMGRQSLVAMMRYIPELLLV